MKLLDARAEKIEIAGRPFKHYCKRISGSPLRVILRPVSSVISPKSCRVCAAIRGATAAALMPATLEPEPLAKHPSRQTTSRVSGSGHAAFTYPD